MQKTRQPSKPLADQPGSQSTPNVQAARRAQSRERRAEQQVIGAVLHAASIYNLFAIIVSGVVWSIQRERSRFIAFQALQAMLFQLVGFLAFILMACLLFAGLYFFSATGVVARTGINEPELTSRLMLAATLGFSAVQFFQVIYPLLGFLAGIRLLRGHNFCYPILGRLAAKWATAETIVVRAEPASGGTRAGVRSGEPVLAGIGHLSVLVGLSPVLVPVLWASAKERSRFLIHHLLQAALFQLLGLSFILVLFLVPAISSLISWVFGPPRYAPAYAATGGWGAFSYLWTCCIGVLVLIGGMLALVAAVRAFQGRPFCYPLVGRWLMRHLAGLD
jgi:uncharacterized Tic20 family protein